MLIDHGGGGGVKGDLEVVYMFFWCFFFVFFFMCRLSKIVEVCDGFKLGSCRRFQQGFNISQVG